MSDIQMNADQKELLEQIADLSKAKLQAYNIRSNGQSVSRASTKNIQITSKTDVSGIDIMIAPGTKHETVHIPVIIDASGMEEKVYNDFYVGADADVLIVAGCGIHNDGCGSSRHDGIHAFHVGENARVRYVEKHYGDGSGTGKRNMNPDTVIELANGSYMEMETTQIKGVDSTKRATKAKLQDNATLIIKEKLFTHGDQTAETSFDVELNGEDCHTNVISRSVAQDTSKQLFLSKVQGNNKCYGHTECDAILMGQAQISAIPQIAANCVDANLVHEAAIGKIAGEQLMKLMTLGLTEAEAEKQIISGFLK